MGKTKNRPASKRFAMGREGILILLILAGALFLRLYGIAYGLPFSYHIDETVYSGAALNLGRAKIGPQTNPTGFTNILFLEYAAYFVLGKISGLFPSVASYEQLYRTDPSSFLLLARLTSAILGALNVLVVYLIGSKVFGKFAGLLSALFLAFVFLHVRDSHYAVPDIAVTFLVSLTLLLCVLSIQKGSLAYQYLAAAAGGYAIATKWNIFPILLPLALTYWINRRSPSARPGLKPALMTLLALAGAFVLGAFQLFIKPGLYLEYIQKELSAGAQGGFYYWQVDTLPGWLFYLKTLWLGTGFLFTGLAVLGVIYYLALAIKSRRVDLTGVLLSFPLAYFLIMGISRHYFARYVLPLLPFAALFSAALLAELYARLGKRRPRAGLALVALIALAVVLPAMTNGLRSDMLLTRTDTRTTAKAWIEANLPAGAAIAMDWPGHAPFLATPDEYAPASSKEYRVATFMDGTGLFDHPLEWYREQGFQYLIATSFIYNIPLVDQEKNLARGEFYRRLDGELELAKEFRPYPGVTEPPFIFDEIYGPLVSLWQRHSPGPTLKIYRLGK